MPSITKNLSNPYEKIVDDARRVSRLQFPTDMGKYYIAFRFAEYGPEWTSLPKFNKWKDQSYKIGNIAAEIALPVPINLLDSTQLSYEDHSLTNVVGAAAMDAFKAAMPRGLQSSYNKIENISGNLVNYAPIYLGTTLNPYMAILFKGPRFKSHQFGWRFSPKTTVETEEITKICNFFKRNSLPSIGTLLMSYPNVVLTSIYPEDARNHMYYFKPAVLTEVAVHYAPSGTPSFYTGTSAPVDIELKIQMTEISIWSKEDI